MTNLTHDLKTAIRSETLPGFKLPHISLAALGRHLVSALECYGQAVAMAYVDPFRISSGPINPAKFPEFEELDGRDPNW